MKCIGAPKFHSQLLYGSAQQRNVNANLLIWKHMTTDNREVHQSHLQKGKSLPHGMGGAPSKIFSSGPSGISNYFGFQYSTADTLSTFCAAQQEAEHLNHKIQILSSPKLRKKKSKLTPLSSPSLQHEKPSASLLSHLCKMKET